MAVKVIVERVVDADKQAELAELLQELRIRAIRQPGYVSGETLFSVDRPGAHLVISTWRSLRDWKAWAKSRQRTEIVKKMAALLTAPERVSVYSQSPRGLPEGA
ncbi:MAG: antibiotic biosynthesis monooxygenase family protein [Chloroflexota bacterium]